MLVLGLTVDGLIGALCPNPVMNILEPEIQPNLPENCQISAFFRTLKTPKSLKPYTVNKILCNFKKTPK